MNIIEKLVGIQNKLKAPKNQKNTFGGYNYRSCEDILEAVKPLMAEFKTALTVGDEIVQIGERIYIKATAVLMDAESSDIVTNVAYAREPETKKGMDDSQITGTASSYARKYALNGLFCIDDTKDADTDAYSKQTADAPQGKKSADAPKAVKCAECGAALKEIKKKDGTPFTVAEMKTYSEQRFGRCLCPACQKKAVNDEAENK